MLTILICTIPERKESFDELISELVRQRDELRVFNYDEIFIFSDDDKIKTIGKKRNDLLLKVKTKYVAFIDDDDMVSRDYLAKIYSAICQYPDCCSLTGVITWDGENPEIFEHSIKYKAYKTNPEGSPIRYERYPNHLNVIKREIAMKFKFPETNHGEDTDWATQIHNSGLLKSEKEIDAILYHYQYKTKK